MVYEVGVVGAGVVGLTTALEVQRRHPDAKVSIIADKFNRETTSDGAPGLVMPFCNLTVINDQITKKVLVDSYEYYKSLIASLPATETGVSMISGYDFSNISEEMVHNPIMEDIVDLYRLATVEELESQPGNWKFGSYWTTIVAESRRLLPYCLNKFTSNGGSVTQGKVSSLSDIADRQFDVVFNCMGLGAREVFRDHKMVPIRGQVFKVVAPWVKNFYFGDHDAYIIPGLDVVTLGGTRNYGSYDLATSRYDSEGILERCCQLVPQLKEAPVERTWVGLRPYRDPVRLEPETVNVAGRSIKLIHNYGHGGCGITSAPGCAVQAVDIMDQARRMSSSQCK